MTMTRAESEAFEEVDRGGGDVRLFSYDVFDTVLARGHATPEGVFACSAERLRAEGLWRGRVEEWVALRRASEEAARRTARGEVTIGEIFEYVGRYAGADVARRALEIELEVEARGVVGVHANIAEIRARQAAGQRTCYVSDMYLDSDFVRALLTKAGAPIAPLFVSSALRKTKASGELFRAVAEHYGIPLSAIEHVGDNPRSDVEVPRKLGVAARRATAADPTPLENRLLRGSSGSDPKVASALVGAMRAARVTCAPAPDAAGTALRAFGAQMGALVHVSFALWVVARMRASAADRVFFLARDGYLPFELYKIARTHDPTLPEARYLYVSRQSLHRAALELPVDQHDMRWILEATDGLTFGEWLFRLGVDYEESFSAQQRARLGFPDCHTPIVPSRYARCATLLESREFLDIVLEHAEPARSLARAYLQQEGFDDSKRPLVVDIGWNGRMQRSLARISGNSRRITGLYLGIARVPPEQTGTLEGWLVDVRERRGMEITRHGAVLETLFSAPHGTVYAYYRAQDGSVTPHLATADPIKDCWPNLVLMHRVIAQVMSIAVRQLDPDHALPNRVERYVHREVARWLRAPSREEAAAFRQFGFGSDQINRSKERLVYDVADTQLVSLCLRGRPLSSNHWMEGQIALARRERATPALRAVFGVQRRVRRALGRVYRRAISAANPGISGEGS